MSGKTEVDKARLWCCLYAADVQCSITSSRQCTVSGRNQSSCVVARRRRTASHVSSTTTSTSQRSKTTSTIVDQSQTRTASWCWVRSSRSVTTTRQCLCRWLWLHLGHCTTSWKPRRRSVTAWFKFLRSCSTAACLAFRHPRCECSPRYSNHSNPLISVAMVFQDSVSCIL